MQINNISFIAMNGKEGEDLYSTFGWERLYR